METADIVTYLRHADGGLKLQAFLGLVARIEKEKNVNVQRSLIDVVYDAAQSPSKPVASAACRWLAAAVQRQPAPLEALRNVGSVFNEVYTRLKRAAQPVFLVRLAFDLVGVVSAKTGEDADDPGLPLGFHQVFLRLLDIVPSEAEEIARIYTSGSLIRTLRAIQDSTIAKTFPGLLDTLIAYGLELAVTQGPNVASNFANCVFEKLSPRHFDLLATNKALTLDFVLRHVARLAGHKTAAEQVSTSNINNKARETALEVADQILSSSPSELAFLLDSGILEHPTTAGVIPLFVQVSTLKQLHRLMPTESGIPELTDRLTQVFKAASESTNETVPAHLDASSVTTHGQWLWWLVDTKKASAIVRELSKLPSESIPTNSTVVLFLFTVFPYLQTAGDQDAVFQCLAKLNTVDNQSAVVNFHICNFSATQDVQLKCRLISSLTSLKLHVLLTQQVVKFIYAVAVQPTKPENQAVIEAAFEGLEAVFRANEWIFHEPEFQAIIALPKLNEPSIDGVKLSGKLRVLKAVCSTESGEKLIGRILALVNERPAWLEDVVQCLTQLSSIEMLEIEAIRKLLRPVVYKAGNERALAAYCHFLATTVIDAEELELAIDAAAELWALRLHSSRPVSAAAFTALASFSEVHLPETLVASQENPTEAPRFLSGSQVFDGIGNGAIDAANADSFSTFLGKMLAIDVENLGRKYFAASQVASGSPLFVALLPVLREVLQTPGNEWQCLCLIDPITRPLLPPSKRAQRGTQILFNGIRASFLATLKNDHDLLLYLSVFKTATETLFSHTNDANNASGASIKRFGLFSIAKTIIQFLAKTLGDQVSLLPGTETNFIICLCFLFVTVQKMLLDEAATDDVKQAFLGDELIHLDKFLHQIIDVCLDSIDARRTPLEKEKLLGRSLTEKLQVSSPASKAIVSCVGVYTLERHAAEFGTLAWDSPLAEALFVLKSAVEASVGENDAVSDGLRLFDKATQAAVDPGNFFEVFEDVFDVQKIKIIGQLFDIDPVAVNIVVEQRKNHAQTTAAQETIQTALKDSKDVAELWRLYQTSSGEGIEKLAPAFGRRLEKVIKEDKSQAKICLDGLAAFAAVFNAGIKNQSSLPQNYTHLPEKSVLRVAVEQITSFSNPTLQSAILKSFIGLKRIEKPSYDDERPLAELRAPKAGAFYHLPPIDWAQLAAYVCPDQSSVWMVIAFEQAAINLFYGLQASSMISWTPENLSFMAPRIAANLSGLIPKLPRQSFITMLRAVVKWWSKVEWHHGGDQIADAIHAIAKNRSDVRQIVAETFVNAETVSFLRSTYFVKFHDLPGIANGLRHIPVVRLWIELAKGERMDVSQLPVILEEASGFDKGQRYQCLFCVIIWMRDYTTAHLREWLLKRFLHHMAASSSSKSTVSGFFDLLVAIVTLQDSPKSVFVVTTDSTLMSADEQWLLVVSLLPSTLSHATDLSIETVSKQLLTTCLGILDAELMNAKEKTAKVYRASAVRCLGVILRRVPSLSRMVNDATLKAVLSGLDAG